MEVVSSNLDNNFNCVEFYNMYPLRIIKQIISMFCSVNPDTKLDDLREFVLNKESIGIDKNRYKICAYFTTSTTCRHSGMTGLLDIKTNKVTLLSEIVYQPLGLLLYLNADDSIKTEGIDITSFADYSYDDVCNIKLPLLFKEVNNWIPHDYRTTEEIEAAIRKAENDFEK